ncbi:hypothetical protein FA15DRAFT_666810 [Coprinopsis marcescibilis]|uniref:F-box domain-containing protein n=1 Tax=Coprinopsis marcescibilis TaxID=230819 RepID=A0A5C3LF08_COPMA|nr:hypothetical protein FA15DRAFT_666810 [Coprinopsis marcescibilis]
MAFNRLPIELLDTICDSLDHRRDLVALSTTNSTLYHVAHRLLYKHISAFQNTPSLKVTTLLAHRPDLARHVRSFAIVLDPANEQPTSYFNSLATALHNMPDIESLKLTIDPAMSWVLPHASSVRYPRLRDFTCVFSFDHHVAQFLGKTGALVHLELGHDLNSQTPLPELLPAWLPNLESFAGSSQVAQAIVPGRPVSSISMHSGDLTEGVVQELAKSTAAILFLDATTASLPLPLLEAMASAIPELQELRLATTYNLWDEWFKTPFIKNIKSALISMDNLQTAEVSGMLWRWLTKDGRVLANEPQVPTDNLDDDDSSYFHA